PDARMAQPLAGFTVTCDLPGRDGLDFRCRIGHGNSLRFGLIRDLTGLDNNHSVMPMPVPAHPNAIEIANLSKTYAPEGNNPAKVALRGLNLNIPAGSIFGLLGPNGAGKSTTINIMAGLVNKTAGHVKIH